jgi:UDP-N-acetylglucosamine transferase subunit ALG13
MSTFVSVGNATQPFTRLLYAVCDLADQLPQPVFVQYGAAANFGCTACSGVAFLEMDEFVTRVQAADLLILHAGAGSALHAIRAGKVPVLVPRLHSQGEHIDDHQMEFALELERTGKAVVVRDASQLLAATTLALQQQGQGGLSPEEPRMVNLLRTLLASHARELGQ